jgi:hypothetical protein
LADAIGHGHDSEPKSRGNSEDVELVAPLPIPAMTAVPQPIRTKANVPMNSATAFFIAIPPW